jgi:hypothetical protein
MNCLFYGLTCVVSPLCKMIRLSSLPYFDDNHLVGLFSLCIVKNSVELSLAQSPDTKEEKRFILQL